MKSGRMVGRITLGVVLIVVGIGLSVSMYTDTPLHQLASYWPVILLVLGAEILWAHRKSQQASMDSLALVGLILVLSASLFHLHGFPLHWFNIHSTARYVAEKEWTAERHPLGSEVHTVFINNLSGDVNVSPSNSRELVVRGEIQVTGSVESTVDRLMESAALNVWQQGSTVQIQLERNHLNNMPNYSMRGVLWIEIPSDLNLRIETTTARVDVRAHQGATTITTRTGSIEVYDLNGPLTVKTTSGRVMLDRISGKLDVTTGTGSVTLNGLTADARINTTTGAVNVALVEGGITVNTSTGRVDCDGVRGDVRIQTTTGQVHAIDAGARLQVNTTTGSITAESANPPSEDWDLSTSSANITVLMPKDSEVNLWAEGRRVNASNFPDLTLTSDSARSVTATGGPSIRLKSQTGTVTITGRTP